MTLTVEHASKIYDILVEHAGARIEDKDDFVYHHCIDKYSCTEWRFCGLLGFGGKYKINNYVTCYSEDETPERLKIIEKTNLELSKIK